MEKKIRKVLIVGAPPMLGTLASKILRAEKSLVVAKHDLAKLPIGSSEFHHKKERIKAASLLLKHIKDNGI
ncbi:hypothetical protein V6R21_32240 [Limibacter armeniacum]|uniref:hypothetical protein n=1 Tax=Limibacter armeniacum TaxID=466084 RepID=UPI002FE607A5